MTIVPYTLDDVKILLKRKAIEEFGITDAQYESSNISQLINLIAYASLSNNLNLTYSARETYLTDATKKTNIVKKAQELGYIHNLSVSYQYLIKLKVQEYGQQILYKGTKFEGNGNTYFYFGDEIIDSYGFELELGNDINVEQGSILEVSNNEPVKVLKVISDNNILIDSEINIYSNEPKEIFYNDVSLGEIDTFLLDDTIFKVQFNYNNYDFITKELQPTENLSISNNVIETNKFISKIESLKIDNIEVDKNLYDFDHNKVIFSTNYNGKTAEISYYTDNIPKLSFSDIEGTFKARYFDSRLNILEFENTGLEDKLINLNKKNYIIIDENKTSIINITKKDELIVPVKEGILKLYNENPNQIFTFNEDMYEKGYFSIQEENLENRGIELFINDERFTQRDSLLLEDIKNDLKTFIVIPDPDYDDIYHIHTNYANTGYKIPPNSEIKVNLLVSKAEQGFCEDLLSCENEIFKTIPYNEETNNYLLVEGNKEGKEEIRTNAPLVKNTGNRAVTSNDYKIICEQEPYIKEMKVWGGEIEVPVDIPGHIFFSSIPSSIPFKFQEDNYVFERIKENEHELFFNRYYQITGRIQYYNERNLLDDTVLFNKLKKYSIITLKHNYIKPIYLDSNLEVHLISKNSNISYDYYYNSLKESIYEYFLKNIEKFDYSYHNSSLIKYLDSKIGDKYGLEIKHQMTIDLIDDIQDPSKSSFENKTKQDLDYIYDSDKGTNDIFEFKLPLKLNFDLFDKDIFKFNLLTNCNTEDFLVKGDYIYLEEDINKYSTYKVIFNYNTIVDLLPTDDSISTLSQVIEIPIIYKKNKDSDIKYQVGSYFIYLRENKTIRLTLNISNVDNIDNTTKEKDLKTDAIKCNLPRKSFETKRQLNINTFNGSFESILNVHGRLNKLEFRQ